MNDNTNEQHKKQETSNLGSTSSQVKEELAQQIIAEMNKAGLIQDNDQLFEITFSDETVFGKIDKEK